MLMYISEKMSRVGDLATKLKFVYHDIINKTDEIKIYRDEFHLPNNENINIIETGEKILVYRKATETEYVEKKDDKDILLNVREKVLMEKEVENNNREEIMKTKCDELNKRDEDLKKKVKKLKIEKMKHKKKLEKLEMKERAIDKKGRNLKNKLLFLENTEKKLKTFDFVIIKSDQERKRKGCVGDINEIDTSTKSYVVVDEWEHEEDTRDSDYDDEDYDEDDFDDDYTDSEDDDD